MAKYQVWGRKEFGKGQRKRLGPTVTTEKEAKVLWAQLKSEGFKDVIVVQLSPSYGQIKGLQKAGRDNPQE